MEGRVAHTYNVNSKLQLRYIEVAPDVIVRGVWARKAFREGALIEECAVTPIYADEPKPFPNAVRSYEFNWRLHNEEGDLVTVGALAAGMGGLYNHSNDPNIAWHSFRPEFRMEFRAIRDIEAGEELVHDYRWGKQPGARLNPVNRYLRPIRKNSKEWPEGID